MDWFSPTSAGFPQDLATPKVKLELTRFEFGGGEKRILSFAVARASLKRGVARRLPKDP